MTIPPTLRAHLERLDGVEELTDPAECLMLSLHTGPHLAFGQLEASLDNCAVDDLWLCWNDDGDGALIPSTMCVGAVVDLNGERMGCQLPRQHLGPHLGFGPERGDSWIYVEQRWLDRPL